MPLVLFGCLKRFSGQFPQEESCHWDRIVCQISQHRQPSKSNIKLDEFCLAIYIVLSLLKVILGNLLKSFLGFVAPLQGIFWNPGKFENNVRSNPGENANPWEENKTKNKKMKRHFGFETQAR